VLLVRFLPESIRYMVANQRSVEQVRAVLMRISNSVKDAASFTMSEPGGVRKGQSGPVIVVSGSYIVGSLMLWISYFMGLVIFYALINWMPILFKDAGIDPRTATLISALFPLGGVGAILFGWFMDRYNGNWIIAIGYGLTAIFIYAIGQSVGTIALLVVIVFIAGALMNTAQSSMPALAASFYPTQGRATGVAWMLGVGRFGGIAGSYLVAELSRRQLTFAEIFTVVAIPGVIAAIALVIKQFVHPEKRIIGLASVARTLAH